MRNWKKFRTHGWKNTPIHPTGRLKIESLAGEGFIEHENLRLFYWPLLGGCASVQLFELLLGSCLLWNRIQCPRPLEFSFIRHFWQDPRDCFVNFMSHHDKISLSVSNNILYPSYGRISALFSSPECRKKAETWPPQSISGLWKHQIRLCYQTEGFHVSPRRVFI
jgi:hypothetical protein